MIFLRMLSDLPRKLEDLRCNLLVCRVSSGWGDVETKQHPDSVCKKNNNLPGFQDLPLLQRILHTKKITCIFAMVFHLWTFQANKNTCWSFAKASNRLWPRLRNSLSLVAHFGQQWSVVLHHPLQLSPDLLRLAPNTSQCSSDHLELHGTCGKQSLAQKNLVCTKQNLDHPSQLERVVNDCARKDMKKSPPKNLQKQHVKTQKPLGSSQISVRCEFFLPRKIRMHHLVVVNLYAKWNVWSF